MPKDSNEPNQLSPAALKARARRVNIGIDAEKRAAKQTPLPSLQGMLQLPLLEELDAIGGRARPSELYDRLAARLDVPEEIKNQVKSAGDGQRYRWFDQQVRWARQTAVMKGLISDGTRGIWELADPGFEKLKKARRGTLFLIWDTERGVGLWGHAEDAAAAIERESVSLVMTSPMYPVKSGRAYGAMDVPAWLDWMLRLTAMWKELLTPDGTIAINLGDCYVSGHPTISPYIERFALNCVDRLGLHMPGRMFWYSPTKLANLEWAGRRRVRIKNSVEPILLFSKTPNPKWDNRRLLVPYSASTVAGWKKDNQRGKEDRPSGYQLDVTKFAPVGEGAIPGNLIVAAGAPGNDGHSRRLRAAGLPAHPARFPEEVPRRLILLTTEEQDVVYDPFFGSGTTLKVAADLNRCFIGSEVMLDYGIGAGMRFDHQEDFRSYPVAA